jgi:hypothetical protein
LKCSADSIKRGDNPLLTLFQIYSIGLTYGGYAAKNTRLIPKSLAN